jgi:hypothetical protein
MKATLLLATLKKDEPFNTAALGNKQAYHRSFSTNETI